MVTVTKKGVNHNWVDQSSAIQSLVDKATSEGNNTLFFPPGSYKLDNPVKLKSNITIIGDKASFVVLGSCGFYASSYEENETISAGNSPVALENITIKGLKFVSSEFKPSIKMKNVKNVHIEDIETSGGGVWINTAFSVNSNDGTSSPNETAGIVSLDYCNNNITIKNLRAYNPNWDTTPTDSDAPYCRGIHIEYGNNIHISDCTINGYSQGIEIWGGDAEPNKGGSTATKLYSNDVFVNNCIVKHCSGGAIWGAMVSNFIISNCTIDHTMDVGIDFESCWNSVASNNIVKNCRVGNLAVYSCCKNILFSNNTSICDSTEYKNTVNKDYNGHFVLSNSANNGFENDIIFDGCTFISSNDNIGEVTWGAARNRIVKNCYFQNVILCYNAGSSGHVNSEITNNKFYFTKNCNNLVAITAMSHAVNGYHSIQNNTIHFMGTLSGTCVGIECYGYNCEGDFFVTDNYIVNMRYGTDLSIRCRQEGTNKMYALIKDNVMNTQMSSSGTVSFIKSGNVSVGGVSFD